MHAVLMALNLFYRVLSLLIVARCFASWFVRSPYGGGKIYAVIYQLTEPLLAPCRALLSRFQRNMMVDFSPILALFLLSFIYRVIYRILIGFMI